MDDLPILYSFRRCPYAMRARMALLASGIEVILREVLLRDKPPELKAISPKATVPVLVLSNGTVMEESLDIMAWALQQNDPIGWLESADSESDWIGECDHDFKTWLDRYKYAERHPEHPAEYYREEALAFISKLESALEKGKSLCGDRASLADVAIFPFIRQFAAVDPTWWQAAPYPQTRGWLDEWLKTGLFSAIMAKYARWEPGQPIVMFPKPSDSGIPGSLQTLNTKAHIRG